MLKITFMVCEYKKLFIDIYQISIKLQKHEFNLNKLVFRTEL